jgi:hypothetical protein
MVIFMHIVILVWIIAIQGLLKIKSWDQGSKILENLKILKKFTRFERRIEQKFERKR